jgi:hypothetical protein
MSTCAKAVDATAAAVSQLAPGAPDVVTMIAIDRRSGRVAHHGDGSEGARYPIVEYPATAALLERGGTAIWSAGDAAAEPGEASLLREWNMRAVLAAAERFDECGWLIELYADDDTADLELIEPVLRVLTVHALYAGVPGDRSRSRAISAAARADTLA